MPTTTRERARLFWPLHLGGWAAFGVAMALSRVSRYPLDYMVATKTVLAGLGVIASLGLRALYRRRLGPTESLGRIIVVTAVASYAIALVWTAAYNLIDARIATAMLDRPVTINSLFELTAGSVYHAFALLAWSMLYIGIQRHLALEESQLRGARAESLASSARLQALRYQLQPHFLFNTLNALSTLIVEGRTDDASRMTSRLGDYFRYTLARGDRNEVPLEDELDLARQYLEIERVRFGDRLTVDFAIGAGADRAFVPTLILQPLIENAIRHAIALKSEPGIVRVEAMRSDNRLRLAVVDDGPGRGAVRPAGGAGIGLGNTRERLAALYGEDWALDIASDAEGRGTRVSIDLPFRSVAGRAG
jgi:two-component system LytT family sensor kinase